MCYQPSGLLSLLTFLLCVRVHTGDKSPFRSIVEMLDYQPTELRYATSLPVPLLFIYLVEMDYDAEVLCIIQQDRYVISHLGFRRLLVLPSVFVLRHTTRVPEPPGGGSGVVRRANTFKSLSAGPRVTLIDVNRWIYGYQYIVRCFTLTVVVSRMGFNRSSERSQ
ncbi:hypothetical protein DEU56DRAFT_125562 [Suillus clintonianus]|uniref:uncharacterized protein n=1 Tax=Suillus clintonianus TaxID=1904413 RepID=UPI001B862B53|nr:uncharacterized protein DEU56DRAFT_125562 [Suillus clintonianus]KAG2119347.1 hypothetical protein DEU56DRAFT_125562 [Suillus clintonianus]